MCGVIECYTLKQNGGITMDYKNYIKNKKKFAKWLLKQQRIFVQRADEGNSGIVYITNGIIAFKIPIETYNTCFRIESGLYPDIKDTEQFRIENEIVSPNGPDIRQLFNEKPETREMKISNIASVVPTGKNKTSYARLFYCEGHISFANQNFLDFILCDDPTSIRQASQYSPIFFEFDAGEEALVCPVKIKDLENVTEKLKAVFC